MKRNSQRRAVKCVVVNSRLWDPGRGHVSFRHSDARSVSCGSPWYFSGFNDTPYLVFAPPCIWGVGASQPCRETARPRPGLALLWSPHCGLVPGLVGKSSFCLLGSSWLLRKRRKPFNRVHFALTGSLSNGPGVCRAERNRCPVFFTFFHGSPNGHQWIFGVSGRFLQTLTRCPWALASDGEGVGHLGHPASHGEAGRGVQCSLRGWFSLGFHVEVQENEHLRNVLRELNDRVIGRTEPNFSPSTGPTRLQLNGVRSLHAFILNVKRRCSRDASPQARYVNKARERGCRHSLSLHSSLQTSATELGQGGRRGPAVTAGPWTPHVSEGEK